jgi:Tol biopolymer transport system component
MTRTRALCLCGLVFASSLNFCRAADRILFDRLGPTEATLFISNADGSAERPLTQPNSLDYNPSWSPKGDWIAYALTVQCMIIHPDGTGARSVLDNERKWMKYTLDSPILWSPDGERLLLNQRKIFDSGLRVIMVDLATGHAGMKSKNGEVVTGWVPYSGK